MSLTQDIRNAYDWRDREGLERLLQKVKNLETQVALLTTPIRQDERCTCQSGPNWRLLIGSIGEPAKCADCKKPVTITAGVPPHHQQFGQACAAALVGQPGVTWNGPVDGQGRPAPIGNVTLAAMSEAQLHQRYDPNDDRRNTAGPTVCTCGAVYGYPHNEGCAKA